MAFILIYIGFYSCVEFVPASGNLVAVCCCCCCYYYCTVPRYRFLSFIDHYRTVTLAVRVLLLLHLVVVVIADAYCCAVGLDRIVGIDRIVGVDRCCGSCCYCAVRTAVSIRFILDSRIRRRGCKKRRRSRETKQKGGGK